MRMQHPGCPLSSETLPEVPGFSWELGIPVGLLNLIQREQEGLGSELGWNFMLLFHELRMVLGRTFKGHPVQFPATIRDTFARSACPEPHPALSTFFLMMEGISLFPLQIQVSIPIGAALPCHEESKLEPQHLPPHLAGFSLSQHSCSSRKSTRRAGYSRADRIPSEMQRQALIPRLRGAWLRQGAGNSFPAGSLLQPHCPSPPPLFQPQGWRKKQESPPYPTFQGSKTHPTAGVLPGRVPHPKSGNKNMDVKMIPGRFGSTETT